MLQEGDNKLFLTKPAQKPSCRVCRRGDHNQIQPEHLEKESYSTQTLQGGRMCSKDPQPFLSLAAFQREPDIPLRQAEAAGHRGSWKPPKFQCRGTARTVSLLPQSSWWYFGRAVLDLGTEVCLTVKSFFGFGLKTLCSAAFVLSSRLRTQGEFGLTIFFLHSHEESCEFMGMEIW